MDTLLNSVQLAAVVAVAAGLLGAVIAQITVAIAGPYVRGLSPHRQFRVVLAISSLPVVMSTGAIFIAFYPTVFDALQWVAGSCHCGETNSHGCLFAIPVTPSWYISVAVLFVVMILTYRWCRLARTWLQRARKAQNLLRLGDHSPQHGCYIVPAPQAFAATVGVWKPAIVISQRLVQALTPEQLEVVLAHERAHQRRRDALLFAVLQWVLTMHLSKARRFLMERARTSTEQLCDRAAAAEVRDSLAVAETILSVTRLNNGQRPPVDGLGFGSHRLEERIRTLLDGPHARPTDRFLAALLLLGIGTALLYLHELHHLVEASLHLVL